MGADEKVRERGVRKGRGDLPPTAAFKIPGVGLGTAEACGGGEIEDDKSHSGSWPHLSSPGTMPCSVAMEETVEWKGSPSQWLNCGVFAICVLVVAGIGFLAVSYDWTWLWFGVPIPLLWALWAYLTVRCRVFELTTQRLRKYEGVLNQTIDELELYRVKDFTIKRPFIQRLVGLSTVELLTSDRTHPEVRIPAIRQSNDLRERLRRQVEFWRDKKRVREVDFDGGSEDALGFM